MAAGERFEDFMPEISLHLKTSAGAALLFAVLILQGAGDGRARAGPLYPDVAGSGSIERVVNRQAPRAEQAAKSGSTAIRSGKFASKATPAKPACLIPPPPPSIPTMMLPALHTIPGTEFVEYLGTSELLELLNSTRSDLDRAEKRLANNLGLIGEKKKRAESFETLFTEGVVSKRELESARNEYLALEESAGEQAEKIKALQARLRRIEKKLETVPAAHKRKGQSPLI